MSAFSETIRRIRFEKQMTQDEFAELLGTTKQNISRYESGAVSPKISTASVIAEKLGISLSELSGEEVIEHDSMESTSHALDNALSAELRDMSDEDKQDVLDYMRFRRAQRARRDP